MAATINPMERKPGEIGTMHERLRWARIRAGYRSSGAAAREHTEFNATTLTSNENGTRGFSLEAAKRYATAFGVSWTWLLNGGDNPDELGPVQPARDMQVSRFPEIAHADLRVFLERLVADLGREQDVELVRLFGIISLVYDEWGTSGKPFDSAAFLSKVSKIAELHNRPLKIRPSQRQSS